MLAEAGDTCFKEHGFSDFFIGPFFLKRMFPWEFY
jgi:hypothetical protein